MFLVCAYEVWYLKWENDSECIMKKLFKLRNYAQTSQILLI